MINSLQRPLSSRRRNRRGVLTLEWILLITILVIGIIAGLGAVRDAILCELKDLADAVAALNISGDEDSNTVVNDNSPPQLVTP